MTRHFVSGFPRALLSPAQLRKELWGRDWVWRPIRTRGGLSSSRSHVNTEFEIYDATVTKTSFKIANLGVLIFFVIMSVCLTSKK